MSSGLEVCIAAGAAVGLKKFLTTMTAMLLFGVLRCKEVMNYDDGEVV
jgi:hypothetical protein